MENQGASQFWNYSRKSQIWEEVNNIPCEYHKTYLI